MKLFRLHLLLTLIYVVSVAATAQNDSLGPNVSLDDYALRVSINEEHHLLRGEASMRLHSNRDSVAQLSFDISPPMESLTVYDSVGKKIDAKDEISATDKRQRRLAVFLPEPLKRGDPISFKIEYEIVYDTLSLTASFINEREILLSPQDSNSWWPALASPANSLSGTCAWKSLEVTLSSAFVVVQKGNADSIGVPGSKITWRFACNSLREFPNGFLFCASKDIVKTDVTSADSTTHISLYYDPGRFNGDLAGAVLRQLNSAYSFFIALSGRRQDHTAIAVAIVGTEDGQTEWLTQDDIVIGRNSYAYSQYDSTILTSSRMNKWIHELAHCFRLSSTNSSFWFNEGWSNYLSTKFFLNKAGAGDEAQRRVRLDLFSTTLDFYPSQTLSEG